MEIPKGKILELLCSRGEADQADQELPDNVDPERDSGLLSKFGVDPSELLGGLGGKVPASRTFPHGEPREENNAARAGANHQRKRDDRETRSASATGAARERRL